MPTTKSPPKPDPFRFPPATSTAGETTPKAATKNPKAGAANGQTKSEFVLGLSRTMPVAEVLKKAAEAGMTISPGHVHTIRSKAKRAASRPTKAKKAPRGTGKPTKASNKKPAGSIKPKAKGTRGERSDFVRSLPRTMPVAEVIKRAKQAGLAVSPDLVRKARGRGSLTLKSTGRKSKAAARAPKKTVFRPSKAAKAAKKRAAPKTPRKARKSAKADFVMSMPVTMPAKKVIEAAANRGLKLSDKYVYTVRSKAKRNAPKKVELMKPGKKATKRKTKREATTAKVTRAGLMTPEMVFARLALDIGLQRAKDLLAAVDEKLSALVATVA